MNNHTLILTSPKLVVPEIKIIEFVKQLILSNLLNVECFNDQLGCKCEYDKEMAKKNKDTTFLIFHFGDYNMDYSDYSEENIFQFIYDRLKMPNIGQVITNDKDIEIYIL
jgi:hypothetical protein